MVRVRYGKWRVSSSHDTETINARRALAGTERCA
jgi:hypothetical protein